MFDLRRHIIMAKRYEMIARRKDSIHIVTKDLKNSHDFNHSSAGPVIIPGV